MSPALAGVSKVDRQPGPDGQRLRVRTRRATACSRPPTALGYVPSTSAVSLATGRTNNIGVVMPYAQPLVLRRGARGDPGRAAATRARPHALRRATRAPRGARASSRTSSHARGSTGSSPSGSSPTTTNSSASSRSAARRQRGRRTPARRPSSPIDDDHAARRATEHLIDLGHTRIAFLGGGGDALGATSIDAGCDGYEATMADAGLGAPAHVPSRVTLPGRLRGCRRPARRCPLAPDRHRRHVRRGRDRRDHRRAPPGHPGAERPQRRRHRRPRVRGDVLAHDARAVRRASRVASPSSSCSSTSPTRTERRRWSGCRPRSSCATPPRLHPGQPSAPSTALRHARAPDCRERADRGAARPSVQRMKAPDAEHPGPS